MGRLMRGVGGEEETGGGEKGWRGGKRGGCTGGGDGNLCDRTEGEEGGCGSSSGGGISRSGWTDGRSLAQMVWLEQLPCTADS